MEWVLELDFCAAGWVTDGSSESRIVGPAGSMESSTAFVIGAIYAIGSSEKS